MNPTQLAIKVAVLGAILLTPKAPAQDDTPLTMDPYTVSAVFPSITVRFALAGENLTDPTNDRIVSAYIDTVTPRGADMPSPLLVGDRVEAIDGVEVKGSTLIRLAEVLSQARGKRGLPVWSIRRGLVPRTLKFDGTWDVPLPGLKR